MVYFIYLQSLLRMAGRRLLRDVRRSVVILRYYMWDKTNTRIVFTIALRPHFVVFDAACFRKEGASTSTRSVRRLPLSVSVWEVYSTLPDSNSCVGSLGWLRSVRKIPRAECGQGGISRKKILSEYVFRGARVTSMDSGVWLCRR